MRGGVEGDGTGRYRFPAAGDRHGATATPRHVRAGLASGMRELNARHSALRLYEARNAGERLNVLVFPDAEIPGRNAAARFHRRGFGYHARGTADSTASEMDQMPVIRESVFGRVLAHRRDNDAIT